MDRVTVALTTTALAVTFAMMGAIGLPMTEPVISPAPAKLVDWIRQEDIAQRPYDHWNYQRSGRTPFRSHLWKMASSSGAITLTGTASRLSPGATGTDLTLSGNMTAATFTAGGGTSTFASLTFQLSAAAADVFMSGSSAHTIEMATTDANTSATVPALWFKTDIDITDSDLAFGYKNSANVLKWGVTESGKTLASANGGTCTLDGLSPSKCTGTVTAGAVCVCGGAGTTAAAAVAAAASVTTTTLTCTAANGLTGNVNYWCDR